MAAPTAKDQSTKIVSQANQTLFGKILPAMVKANGFAKNMVASPFSLCSVLAMLHAGAAGETAKEIRDVLALPSDDKIGVLHAGFEEVMKFFKSSAVDEFTLEASNRVYIRDGSTFVQAFLDLVKKSFGCFAQSIDFSQGEEARKVINKCVEKQTNKKIKELLPQGILGGETSIVLVNAVCFKGSWKSKFDKSNTKEEDFVVSKSKTVRVKMMHQLAWYAVEKVKALGCTVLQKRYKGDTLEMLFFLSDTPEGFANMEKGLATFDFQGLRLKDDEVDCKIPRFKLEAKHALFNVLRSVGIVKMFDEGSADFSNLSKNEKLFVSYILQKALVEVNEEGTEAAAATVAVLYGESHVDYQEPMQFICNRPFIFVIRSVDTGLILFNGRVMNPSE